jgi:glycogen operon protein
MQPSDWNTSYAKALGLFIDGSIERDEDFYIAFNAHFDALPFTIPCELQRPWLLVLSTAGPEMETVEKSLTHDTLVVDARSIVILRSASRELRFDDPFTNSIAN